MGGDASRRRLLLLEISDAYVNDGLDALTENGGAQGLLTALREAQARGPVMHRPRLSLAELAVVSNAAHRMALQLQDDGTGELAGMDAQQALLLQNEERIQALEARLARAEEALAQMDRGKGEGG